VDENNVASCRYPASFWHRLIRDYHKKRFNLWLIFMQSRNKLDVIFDGKYITIKCDTLLKYKDEYSLKKKREDIKKSGQAPENVRPYTEIEIEKDISISIPHETFWKKYPNRVGSNKGSKSESDKLWTKMKDKDREEAYNALDRFIQCKQWKDGYIPQATKYLRQRLFDDLPLLGGNGSCLKCHGTGSVINQRMKNDIYVDVSEPCPECGGVNAGH
jgi:hypothetical protein